ncbi:MAG: PilZ domain-containing protein [Myxococcota bacterium]
MSHGQRTLRVAFESPEAFQREFDSNLANGGVFVRTEEPYDLREQVQVELYFDYSGESVHLDAEVVHIAPPEMSDVGGKPGVAVQFQMHVQDLRERLGALATSAVAASAGGDDAGQRGAQRKPVRVAARIQGDQQVVAGQTRNLSLTGVLVGVGGHSIPLGETVSLMLEHPTTGESRTIEGKVVRQVESDGEVSAVAVEFLPGEDREGTQRFVEDLQGYEHTRRLGGISGPIEELGPLSLLQMFTTTAPRGTLVLRCDQEEGIICFDGGLLRLARLGSTTGMKALVRMLSWKDGVFEFQSRIDEQQITGAPFPLEAALLDAVRQMDEGTTVDAQRFPLHATLARNEGGDLGAYGDLSKVESAVLDLAAAGFTVQRALEVIPEPDPEIFRALQALCEAELILIDG